MRLARVQVQNFRSIVNSEIVDIDDRVTVIVGKNEQGKTTFLRGLFSFNEKYPYSPNDLPHHLRPKLDAQKKAEIPIVSVWLLADTKERGDLSKIVNLVGQVAEIKITRYYDGHYAYMTVNADGKEAPLEFTPTDISAQVADLRLSAETLKKDKFSAHASRQATFAAHRPQADTHIDAFLGANFKEHGQIENLIKTLITALTGVPGQDQPIQDDIANMAREMQSKFVEIQRLLQQDKRSLFQERIPKFVFHSTLLDQIPNDVNLGEFLKDPEATSKGMARLCRAAGLSTQRIQELSMIPEAAAREPYEDHHNAAISGAINDFWTQQSYTIYFRIERERLSVSIEDGTYKRRIAPSDRSEGFRWYLSFHSMLQNEASSSEPVVLLLDNPGLELHADGQRDIKRSLEEKHSVSMQVIYVTHSPAMIDPYNLEQVRRADLLGNLQGTKVRRLEVEEGHHFDLLEPVRSALGVSLVTSLMANQFNLLAEGAADRPIFEAAIATLAQDKKDEVLVSGSVAETLDLLPSFFERAKLPYIVYVDSDAGGRNIEAKLKAAGIPEQKIVSLRAIFNSDLFAEGVDFELEDLLSDNFYAKAVNETYPGKNIEVPPNGGAKRAQRYDAAFRERQEFRFNKRRVAEKIKLIALREGFDDLSKANIQRAIDRLIADLMAQVAHN